MFSATTNHSLAAAASANSSQVNLSTNHSLAAAASANSSQVNLSTNHSSVSTTNQDLVSTNGNMANVTTVGQAVDRNIVHVYPVHSTEGAVHTVAGATTLVYTTNAPLNYSRDTIKRFY